jgi:hypothetical protein
MLKIFVLGHSADCFKSLPPKDFLQPINLNDLALNFPNDNRDGEARFFLQPESSVMNFPEYVGTLTYRHNQKYPGTINLEVMDCLERRMAPNVVYASAPTETNFKDWVAYTNAYHRTIGPFLRELADLMGMSLHSGKSLWANNFVCHRDVMADLMRLFREVYPKAKALFGDSLGIKCDDPNRPMAYLLERVTMIYFSNRTDLEIRPMPQLFSSLVFFGSYTGNYKVLHDLWRKTLIDIGVKPKDIRAIQYSIPDPPSSGEVRFKTKAYSFCLLMKVKNILTQLKTYDASGEDHQYVVYSDCDTWFFQHREASWKEIISFFESSESDLFYPFERIDEDGRRVKNAGFLIFRRSKLQAAIRYYESAVQILEDAFASLSLFDLYQKYPFIDQSLLNMESSFGVKIAEIPERWHIQGNYFKESNAKTVLFHHAIHCHTVREKMDQIEATAMKLAYC